jgi:hypothetical protein
MTRATPLDGRTSLFNTTTIKRHSNPARSPGLARGCQRSRLAP